MMVFPYDRAAAVAYARRWAYARNPAYYDFDGLGGDCTNFASQCLFAGSGVMNGTPDIGWYFHSLSSRSAAWTGVEYFYRFLTNNAVGSGVGRGNGPFAAEVALSDVQEGDFIQLGAATGDFYHTPVVVGFSRGVPLVAAHTFDAFARPLTAYAFDRARGLHILGVRTMEG